MNLNNQRVLLSESRLVQIISGNSKGPDMSFVKRPINLKDIDEPMKDMQTRRFPALRQIMKAITGRKIILCMDENKANGLVYAPSVATKDPNNIVSVVYVNITKHAKTRVVVDSLTGNTKQIIDINYEVLFNLLLGAITMLNTSRLMNNANLVRYVRNIYTDIMVTILSRSFGNPMYGDKLRFIIHYFFAKGGSARDLAQATAFDANKAEVLIRNHPDYFNDDPLDVEDLMSVIDDEFESMNNVDAKVFASNCMSMLGESAFYSVDNLPYFLGVVAVKCRRDRVIFNGHVLRAIDEDKSQIINLILQSL